MIRSQRVSLTTNGLRGVEGMGWFATASGPVGRCPSRRVPRPNLFNSRRHTGKDVSDLDAAVGHNQRRWGIRLRGLTWVDSLVHRERLGIAECGISSPVVTERRCRSVRPPSFRIALCATPNRSPLRWSALQGCAHRARVFSTDVRVRRCRNPTEPSASRSTDGDTPRCGERMTNDE